MNHYIALLRGINVGGHKLIKMSDLKLMFEKYGFDNVSTYIQSGNVVFSTEIKNKIEIKEQVENAIRDVFYFEVAIIILTNKELTKALEKHVFLKDNLVDTKSIYFSFLDKTPGKEDVVELNNMKQETEFFKIFENNIYCYYPNGVGNSKWNSVFFEKKLKVKCTTRNYNTVKKLVELSENLD